jgi:UDPglucose 6-dehydrogenase
MKENSDNFKESAILDIINILIKKNINIIIFEPYLNQKTYNNLRCYSNLEKFINDSDIIVANRLNDDLKDFNHKVYSRDIFRKN